MQDRHRQVECDVYGKPMRSNNLKRHKKTHKDLSLSDSEIKDEVDKKSYGNCDLPTPEEKKA